MIGKQIKGRSFRGLLNYLENKERAELIGGNMVGKNARELAAEFCFSRQLNPKLERAVYHASLSLPKPERLDMEQWNTFASDYLQGMGFDYNQYCVFRHHDREHDHVHIVASRIRLDGKTVSDSWDYKRSEQLLRQLEREYGLEAPRVQDKGKRSPTTGQKRRQMREQEEYERGERETPPELTVQEKLQAAIDEAAQGQPTMPQLIHRLKEAGIDATVTFYRTGRVQGITYGLDKLRFSGTKLGRAYTFPGLQKHKGISYEPIQDEVLREAIAIPSVKEMSENAELPGSGKRERYRQLYERYSPKVKLEPETKDRVVAARALNDQMRSPRTFHEVKLILSQGEKAQEINAEQGREAAILYVQRVAIEETQRLKKRQWELKREQECSRQLDIDT